MPKNSFIEILSFIGLYISLNYYSFQFSKHNSMFKTFVVSTIAFGCLGVIMGSLIKW